MPRYPLVVFDWDGTLLDSTAGIALAIQDAARDMGLPVPSRDAANHVIGLGLHDALNTAVPSLAPAQYAAFVEHYRKHFFAQEESMSLFDGIPELLRDLHARGHELAVATGKSRKGLDRALAATGLGPLFVATRCADETHPKPHPAMLLELMQVRGRSAPELLMIGDTSHDLGMAKSAGVDAIAVTYGAHAGEGLRGLAPRACVESVTELRQWLMTNG
jgi:phosphoglycolate phosphatase